MCVDLRVIYIQDTVIKYSVGKIFIYLFSVIYLEIQLFLKIKRAEYPSQDSRDRNGEGGQCGVKEMGRISLSLISDSLELLSQDTNSEIG